MIRLILAISLITLSALGSYYFVFYEPNTPQLRPAISEAKQQAIARRAEQKASEHLQDAQHQNAVIELESKYQ